jgi:hypothetical protein
LYKFVKKFSLYLEIKNMFSSLHDGKAYKISYLLVTINDFLLRVSKPFEYD